MKCFAAAFCILVYVFLANCQHSRKERVSHGGSRFKGHDRHNSRHIMRFSQQRDHGTPRRKGNAHVINVNHMNKGFHDANHFWKVDCNSHEENPHKYITGIWDDHNNFNDLDKLKCGSQGEGITLDLDEYIDVISLNSKHHGSDVHSGQCKAGFVLTGIFDKTFGFPSPNLAKCNKVLYGELDNKDLVTKYTESKAGGPYGPYDHWKVQCPERYAAVGLEKRGGKIKTLLCAYLIPHHKEPHHEHSGHKELVDLHKEPISAHSVAIVEHTYVSGHKEPTGAKKSDYAHVFEVNYLNKGYHDAHHYWNVDCNSHADYPHKYITGIWDDYTNFTDLDKVKCDSLGDGFTLDLKEYIDVIPLNRDEYGISHHTGLCKPGYVLTALYDKAFGFPSPSLAKCNKVLYGELDNKNLEVKYTEGKARGPYEAYEHWKVQCPEHYVAVGLQKHDGRINALFCAYLELKHDDEEQHHENSGYKEPLISYKEVFSGEKDLISGYKEPIVGKGDNYALVFEVNYLNKGHFDAYHNWNVDCNSHEEYPHKYITGIWDDDDSFKDLDKVKCDSLGESITVDVEEYIDVIFLDPKMHESDQYTRVCKPGYVLTALYDKAFGFPSVSLGKCNKILYGKLDNKDIKAKVTEGQDGGPYGAYDRWYVQCPDHYVAIGLEKHYGKIKTLICAHLVVHHV